MKGKLQGKFDGSEGKAPEKLTRVKATKNNKKESSGRFQEKK